MSSTPIPGTEQAQPATYQIRVKGHLEAPWSEWFEDMAISLEDDGITLLTGIVVDQAALYGLLRKVRDLGMPLVSVIQVQQASKKEKLVNTSSNVEIKDRKNWLSILWVFAVLNYVYADVFSLFFLPNAQSEAGKMAAGAVLGFAVLMETAIVMVVLARLLKRGANRWANIVAGAIHTLSVVASLFGGTPPGLYMMFFATVEVACTLFIIWYAWTWPRPQA